MRSLIGREICGFLEGARGPPPTGVGLDVLSLLETSLGCLDPSLLRDACRDTFKISHLPGMDGVQVPQEGVYLLELSRILRSWLPSWVQVIPQFNAGLGSLIVVPSEANKILLEIVATAPIQGEGSVVEHFECVIKIDLLLFRCTPHRLCIGVRERMRRT